MTQKQCPICGDAFDGWNGVKGHITKSKGDHDGLSGPRYIDNHLSDNNTDSNTNTNNTDSTGEKDPVMGSGETGDTGGSKDMYELPCGHEKVNLNKYESPINAHCDTCGNNWELTW